MSDLSDKDQLNRGYWWEVLTITLVATDEGREKLLLLGSGVACSDSCPSSVPSSVTHVHLIMRRRTRSTNLTASPFDSLCNLPNSTAMVGGPRDCSLMWVLLSYNWFRLERILSFPFLWLRPCFLLHCLLLVPEFLNLNISVPLSGFIFPGFFTLGWAAKHSLALFIQCFLHVIPFCFSFLIHSGCRPYILPSVRSLCGKCSPGTRETAENKPGTILEITKT